jgi:hypothetical protein
LGGVSYDGDPTLMDIQSTNDINLPCRVSFTPHQDNNRGRSNYGSGTTDNTRSIAAGKLQLQGVAGLSQGVLTNDNLSHRSSIFGMALKTDGFDRQLRVAIATENGKYRLEASITSEYSTVSMPLGELALAPNGGFGIGLEKSRRGGIVLRLSAGGSEASYYVYEELAAKGLDGWSYGLLLDNTADNLAPYTWLMSHGPKPSVMAP